MARQRWRVAKHRRFSAVQLYVCGHQHSFRASRAAILGADVYGAQSIAHLSLILCDFERSFRF
eukprot:11172211-Lingulodinium_polyedra.AAC.1